MKEKKKILFIINSLRCGGAERLLVDILCNFDYNRFNVDLLVFDKEHEYMGELPSNVRVQCILKMDSKVMATVYAYFKSTKWLNKYFEVVADHTVGYYDTIISFLEGFPLFIHQFITSHAKTNITYIHTDLSTYNTSAEVFGSTENQGNVYSRMDKIVFVSVNAMQMFEKIYPENTRIKISLDNFIDIAKVSEMSNERHPEMAMFNIVTVGRLNSVKGFDLLVDVAKACKEDDLNSHIYIIGEGVERQPLERKISEYNVSDYITLVGFTKNPHPYTKQADVYVNSSIAEGLPLSMIEAMSLGCPIIASPTIGAKLMLGDGTGVIVHRNPKDFYEAIKKLYINKSLRMEYSKLSVAKANGYDKFAYMQKLYTII